MVAPFHCWGALLVLHTFRVVEVKVSAGRNLVLPLSTSTYRGLPPSFHPWLVLYQAIVSTAVKGTGRR